MRCNVGVDPIYLADQHLVELAELKMVPGKLRSQAFKISSPTPSQYCLGAGHMRFFFDKLEYLAKRHAVVLAECKRRGRNVQDHFAERSVYPLELWNDWTVTERDSLIVRERIACKLIAKQNYWRYEGKVIKDLYQFADCLVKSPLFIV